MKKSGVIRKIDELGRIVVPKEIRKVLNIKEYDDIEFWVEEDRIILSKFSRLLDSKADADKLILMLKDLTNAEIYISDKQNIITNGALENQKLPDKLLKVLDERKEYMPLENQKLSFGDISKAGYFYSTPIIKESDSVGLVIIFSESLISKDSIMLAKTIQKLIENK